MPIDQTRLNASVSEAAAFLTRVLSPRIESMRLLQHDGYCQIYLNNLYQADHPLVIDTQNREITVSFGDAHTHYDADHAAMVEDQLVGGMLEKVVRVINGIDRSFAAWSGDRCLGAGWFSERQCDRWLVNAFPLASDYHVTGWVLEDNLRLSRGPSLGLGGR